MPKHGTFSAKFKTQIALELLTGTKTMAKICRDHNLKDQVVRRWKADFLARAESVFAGDAIHQEQLERIAELERLVGRLTMELEVAKKLRSSGPHSRVAAGVDRPALHCLSRHDHRPSRGSRALYGLLSAAARR